MRIKFFLTLLTITFIFMNSASAAKIDIYREAILNKTFTIKYKISTPPIYQDNKDASLSGENFSAKSLQFVSTQTHDGIVVQNGEDRYTEIFLDVQYGGVLRDYESGKVQQRESSSKGHQVGTCRLTKNGEIFNFYYTVKNGNKEYYGSFNMFGGKNGNVKAANIKIVNPYEMLRNEYNLGSLEITKALMAILPKDKIIDTPQTPNYKFVGSGNLENGLSYEDFTSDKDNIFSAVRYYFDGDNITKIAQASYLKEGGNIQSYEKSVIDIEEFSVTPDMKYLSLPSTLKDKTNRNKEKSK